MEQRSFEGTWEEILRYAPELVGQRVRLTVRCRRHCVAVRRSGRVR